MKNSATRSSTWIAVAIVVVLAITGLLFVKTDRAAADRTGSGMMANVAAPAEEASSATDRPPTATFNALPSIVRMLSALVIVIACLYASVYGLRRLSLRRQFGSRKHQALEIVETVYVAPKKTVALIRVADRAVLVGITDSQVSALAELDSEETARIMQDQPDAESASGFKDALSSAVGRLRLLSRNKAAVPT